jgi:hypothetical protein
MDHATHERDLTMTTKPPAKKPKFCSECGAPLVADAIFCHACGTPLAGTPPAAAAAAASGSDIPSMLRWGVPTLAVIALIVITAMQYGTDQPADSAAGAMPLGATPGQAPDISAMSPEERADRLFNRVMRLSSEGKTDSAAFFGTMAFGALEALTPLNLHRRYDMGLVALVTGDVARAKAQADAILADRPTHLLGLSLAARVADARGDAAGARALRRRLLAAESAELKAALQEYTDHEPDVRAAVDLARKG